MRNDVAILGVGMTRFAKQAERGHVGLAGEAVREAVAHAGVDWSLLGAGFCGSAMAEPGLGQRVFKDLGWNGRPIINVENACASGSTALLEACAWIRGGLCEAAIAVGVEILSPIAGTLPTRDAWFFETGLNLPGWYALKASRHQCRHGLTNEQLASVAVKNRACAAHNPRAYFQNPVTVEEVIASPMIADPLTRLQCCPKADGAAAVIVAAADFARSRGMGTAGAGPPIWIRGMALTSGLPVFTDQDLGPSAGTRAASLAYEQAGFGPEELDLVECHDAFTIGEILCTEELGLCPVGEGGAYAASGASTPGRGRTAVNPSGGLLGKGHPLGATGIAQIAELVWQLRGEAGPRQLPRPRLAAAMTMGGGEFELEANACAVFILESEKPTT